MSKLNLAQVITRNEASILAEWLRVLLQSARRRDAVSEDELRSDSRNLLGAICEATRDGTDTDVMSSGWAKAREVLADLSRRRAISGAPPSETAMFVLSLKQPLFDQLRREFGGDANGLADAIWASSLMLDRLGLFTMEIYQKSREDVIARQQQEMLELSTPVVELWDGVLALPLIGTLDSSRTQVVMQNLLEAIVAKESSIAIIDITGVPTVDTLVAQHLLKTVAAARLMGADCIISGIRPQIAQTIIHLGVELGNVTTKATLADAFQIALRKLGRTISKA